MRIKFIIQREWKDAVLGLRFDPSNGEVLIGGSKLYAEDMLSVLYYFSKHEPTVQQHPRSHRMKMYVEGVTEEEWDSGLISLRDRDWKLRITKSFRRLMT